MTCYHPLVASRHKAISKNYDPKKKIHILGSAKDYFLSHTYTNAVEDVFLIPCGKCIGCRIDRARDWSVRLCHEASTSSSAYFLTLTFDEEHFGNDVSIRKQDFQDFIKNVRNYFYFKCGVSNIRYFGCGEYGDSSGRKHYHLILFNCPIDDLKVQSAKNGNIYYSSDVLSGLWNNGFVVIGECNLKTTQYVARYTLKKYGLMKDLEEKGLEAPFILMSTRPGIGYDWCCNNDYVIYDECYVPLPNGKRASVPKYYWKILEKRGFDVDSKKNELSDKIFDKEFNDYLEHHDRGFSNFNSEVESDISDKFKHRGEL